MSSTNRSNARKEHTADYYVTPIKEIETFLKEFDKVCDFNWNDCLILDISAGGNEEVKDEQGNVIKSYHPMSYPEAINNVFGKCNIKTFDIREDSLANIKADYLKLKDIKTLESDIIITNPPFSLSMEFIKKALDDVNYGGYVIMLLRLNFLETKARKKFFEEYMPQYIFVHHKRMSFTDNNKTDSCAYCHMVWQKGNYPEFAKIKVI